MEHLFLPYELALLAKEKGFNFKDKDILGFYSEKYRVTSHSQLTKKDESNPAPLYQQIVDWFRDNHGICFDIDHYFDNECMIIIYRKDADLFETPKLKYYEALNKAIEEAFKLI